MTHDQDVAPAALPTWRDDTLLGRLGPAFYTELAPQALPDVQWLATQPVLAQELGLTGWMQSPDALALLSGNAQPPVGWPRATVYSGHQFGVWAGQLGDGRALTLGELDTPAGVWEVQLKGSGRTPYSRMGDGRAVLRSSIREFLCSEAMHALGIPTTRALALIGSPAPVRRETIETAAVVTRLAPSFLRFGHFEHFTHTARDTQALQHLTDTVIDRFYPACRDAAVPAAALLEAVAGRTAELMADWQAVGFCHGVMNTDNLSILGLTIDYGPFGFLDGFDPGHICNHTDQQGRYAYARQPGVAYWNLHALAQALVPLIGADTAPLEAALEPFRAQFPSAMLSRMRAKLGLLTEHAQDQELSDDLLRLMAAERVDYTIAWRRLGDWQIGKGVSSEQSEPQAPGNARVRDLFIDRAGFDAWALRYDARLRAEASDDASRRARMQRVNPKYVLRNHLAERAIQAAQAGDPSEVNRLLSVLLHPYDEQPAHEADAGFPPDWARGLEVSCSS